MAYGHGEKGITKGVPARYIFEFGELFREIGARIPS